MLLQSTGFVLPYLWLIPALSCLTIALVVPATRRLLRVLESKSTLEAAAWRLDLAEKGTLAQKATMPDEGIFELEKRAFFSKVGLSDIERDDETDDGRRGSLYATEVDSRS